MPTFSNSARGWYDLELYAGDRNYAQFSFTADGVPWDMTGATLTAQIRKRPEDTVPAVEADITEIDSSVGQWGIEWDGETIRAALGDDQHWYGVWDLQVLEAGQTLPTTYLRGGVHAQMDVTR